MNLTSMLSQYVPARICSYHPGYPEGFCQECDREEAVAKAAAKFKPRYRWLDDLDCENEYRTYGDKYGHLYDAHGYDVYGCFDDDPFGNSYSGQYDRPEYADGYIDVDPYDDYYGFRPSSDSYSEYSSSYCPHGLYMGDACWRCDFDAYEDSRDDPDPWGDWNAYDEAQDKEERQYWSPSYEMSPPRPSAVHFDDPYAGLHGQQLVQKGQRQCRRTDTKRTSQRRSQRWHETSSGAKWCLQYYPWVWDELADGATWNEMFPKTETPRMRRPYKFYPWQHRYSGNSHRSRRDLKKQRSEELRWLETELEEAAQQLAEL